MKIQFYPNLPHQMEAVNTVLGIFKGRETYRMHPSMHPSSSADSTGGRDPFQNRGARKDLAIGNRLDLPDDKLLANIRAIQIKQGLQPSKQLGTRDFSVEMETGTGKTYVYLRTIFEMNLRLGFTKFIIVVPSIAVKEGVFKSLRITEQHFKALHDNVQYDYFLYDSRKLGDVRHFATSSHIQIMVINIDAFRKSFIDPSQESKANIIHRPIDRMGGNKPIEFIQAAQPVVIIDEPQSVDNTHRSKQAIASLNPLCTLRYSATHREKHHLMYRLDSVDAYERKLVKQIEVASIHTMEGFGKPYIRLLNVDGKKSPATATIEFDKLLNSRVKRTRKKVKSGEDLFKLSNGISRYGGYVINDICCCTGKERISFSTRPEKVGLHQAIGDVGEDEYKRMQIRMTIEEHLEKELKLMPMGIKVLSLFFIDRVANYRSYDDEGNPIKGKYAVMFEEEYRKLMQHIDYRQLFSGSHPSPLVEQVHDGYFAVDGKTDTRGEHIFKESRGMGISAADGTAYELIMRDKEKLLSFGSQLKFIFSHSALKEGWDNPNVFQICTLNETASLIRKRQEMGRGMRIAVNQEGEQVHGFDVNTLTVVANESYDDFVRQLQKEIEGEQGIKKAADELNIRNKDQRIKVSLNKKVFLGQDFKELWNRIKYKTAFQVDFDVEELIGACAREIRETLVSIAHRTASDSLHGHGKGSKENPRNPPENKGGAHDPSRPVCLCHDGESKLPDIVDYLQQKTRLKRQTLVAILTRSERLGDFRAHPWKFMETVGSIIKARVGHALVEGIRYEKMGEDLCHGRELFEIVELTGYLNRNMLVTKKSIYDHVIYDSALEKRFAMSLEQNRDVKLYLKLPEWFTIPTPLGTYNPHWAVVVEWDRGNKLFIVVETRGGDISGKMPSLKRAKIRCGQEHFRALDEGQVRFQVAEDFQDIIASLPEKLPRA